MLNHLYGFSLAEPDVVVESALDGFNGFVTVQEEQEDAPADEVLNQEQEATIEETTIEETAVEQQADKHHKDHNQKHHNDHHNDHHKDHNNDRRHGRSGSAPRGAPPSYTPKPASGLKAVDPMAIERCLYSYTYVWLSNGRHFWFYPTFIGRRSVSGYLWSNNRWVYIGFDLNLVDSFFCGGR